MILFFRLYNVSIPLLFNGNNSYKELNRGCRLIFNREEKMNKKIVLISLLAAVLVVATGFTPALASSQNTLLSIKHDLVTIEVNHHLGRQTKQIRTTVAVSEAEEIRQYLSKLYDAQERNDYQAILKYELLLNEKGIFGDSYQKISPNIPGVFMLEKTTLPFYPTGLADENISNTFCYFNAIGEGLVAWWLAVQILEGIITMIKNASSLIVALIILLTFLPFFVLTMLFTNLIPFRILAPKGVLSLVNGTIFALGLQGFQRVEVGAESYAVNLSGFTGITINIPPINDRKSFLFVSGFALKAEKT